MKNILLKIITVIIGIFILCLVFEYFFHFDLWNLFMLPLFRSFWNFIGNVIGFIESLFN